MAESEKYRKEHDACPACSSPNVEAKTLGMINLGVEPKDTNAAKCLDCGWKGIVDDLLGDKIQV